MQGRILKLVMMMIAASNASAEELVIIDDRPPSLEFLKYLGDMVEADGELVGPVSFDDADDVGTRNVGQDEWISRDSPSAEGSGYRD